MAGIRTKTTEIRIGGRPLPGAVDLRIHNDPPISDLDRSLIRVWLGSTVYESFVAMDPGTVEIRLREIANRSRFYRRWKFHLLARCLARQVEEVINGTV